MNAKQQIKLDKAIRFTRMASQALDDLLWNDLLTEEEKMALYPVEAALTGAAESMGRTKERQVRVKIDGQVLGPPVSGNFSTDVEGNVEK